MNAKMAKKIRRKMKVFQETMNVGEETSYTIDRVGVIRTNSKSSRSIYQRTKDYIKQNGGKDMWGVK